MQLIYTKCKLNFLHVLFFLHSDYAKFIFSYFIIISIFIIYFSRWQNSAQFATLSIAAFDDPVFFHGRFHAFVAPLDSRFKIPDATMEELSFRGQHSQCNA